MNLSSSNGWITLSMAALIRRLAVIYPRNPALSDGHRTVTYRELDARTDMLAAALSAAGVRPGDCIATLTVNGVAMMELFFAAAKARAVILPLNWRLAPAELSYILGDGAPSLLFVSRELEELSQSIERGRARIIHHDDSGDSPYDTFLAGGGGQIISVAPQPDDLWIMLYTSGTTGRPKGCQLDQKGQVIAAFTMQSAWCGGPIDRVGSAQPLFHVGGLSIVFSHLVIGASVIMAPRNFTADRALDFLIDNRCTISAIPLQFLATMAAENRRRGQKFRLRRIVMGGGMHEAAQLIEMREAFNAELTCGYGQTEAGTFIACLSGEEQLAHPKSCGRALSHFDICILDEAGNPVPRGEGGELCVRGPSVMAGYLNQPDATAAALAGGWLHTGDLFSLDEDGFLTLLGRKKELIKSGGENVYPKEVEGALMSHPDVIEVAVFGVPHEKWGEAVKAVVALRPGATADVQSLVDWCRRSIARYKCPRFIEFVAELPRADTGKLLMRDLRAGSDSPGQSSDDRGAS